jgi:hypothetical protein
VTLNTPPRLACFEESVTGAIKVDAVDADPVLVLLPPPQAANSAAAATALPVPTR